MSNLDDKIKDIVEEAIGEAIETAMRDCLAIEIQLDSDGDIRVVLYYDGDEIHEEFLAISEVKEALEKLE